MKISDNNTSFNKKTPHIGNIEVSRAVILARLKKEQQDAQAKKLMQKNFYSNSKPRSNFIRDDSRTAPPMSPISSVPASPFIMPAAKYHLDDYSPFPNFDDSANFKFSTTKLMNLSKKIMKSEQKPPQPLFRNRTVNKMSLAKIKNKENIGSKAKLRQSPTRTMSTDMATPKDVSKFDHEDLMSFGNVSPQPLLSGHAPHHETLKYSSDDNLRHYQFHCFKDGDLVPKQFAEFIISHDMDDDCATDGEQIEIATKSMHFSLKFAAEDVEDEEPEN